MSHYASLAVPYPFIQFPSLVRSYYLARRSTINAVGDEIYLGSGNSGTGGVTARINNMKNKEPVKYLKNLRKAPLPCLYEYCRIFQLHSNKKSPEFREDIILENRGHTNKL